MDNSFEYIKKIIRAYLNDEKINIDDSYLNDIYRISCLLNVPCVVAHTLDNRNKDIFDKCIYKAVNKYNILNNYKNIISNIFNENNIKYIFLKGETIAKYYKEPYLRYSGDLDILININDYDKALDIMIKNLSFSIKHKSLNEYVLVNKENVNIDFHKQLELDNPLIESVFDNIFVGNELDDNYKYIYHIVHTVKHFILGQLDLKTIIDLFYLRKNINKDFVYDILDKLHLLTFDNSINHYLDYLLENEGANDVDLMIDEYLLSYAKDQGAYNRVNNNKNRFKYLFKHAFPSFKEMTGVFPYLKKAPFLLPWAYFVRIFKALIRKRRKYIFNELSAKNDSKSGVLIDILGISSYNKK